MRLVLVVMAGLAASCGCEDNTAITLRVDGPAWLEVATRDAVDFWDARGVEAFTFVEAGEDVRIVARVPGTDDSGHFSRRALRTDVLSVNDAPATPLQRKCVVVHELGHALGIDEHVPPPSTMAEVGYVGAVDCWWSEHDAAALKGAR